MKLGLISAKNIASKTVSTQEKTTDSKITSKAMMISLSTSKKTPIFDLNRIQQECVQTVCSFFWKDFIGTLQV